MSVTEEISFNGPKWTSTQYNNVKGEDHLGIKFVSILIADTLQSGVTSITPRARYWSFFIWVLHDFIQNHSDKSLEQFKKYLKRQEWFYVLANIADAEERGKSTNQVMGVTVALKVWNECQDIVPLRTDYLKNTFGGYSVYRNVMKTIGLIKESDQQNVQLDLIRKTGKELAEAFEETIQHTVYYQKYRLSEEEVPKEVLREYGKIAGLSRLNSPQAKDQLILRNLFIPTDPKHISEQLRQESLHYYLHILKQAKSTSLSRKNWRYYMYEVFSSKGEFQQAIPDKFSRVAKGWEIYQARQYFTYSLESIWSFVLDLLARRPSSREQLLSRIHDELMEVEIPFDLSVKEVMEQYIPLKFEDRERYIDEMNSETMEINKRVWYPILVLLDVYKRLTNREDFNDLHKGFLTLGKRENISFETWFYEAERFNDLSVGELIEKVIVYYILNQHQNVALRKLITTRNETYHFVEDEGKLRFIHSDSPAFNVFRVNQGLSILGDLGFISDQE
ncbi:hypothetical protein J2S74_000743 [Evansella vedderi]|uniref:Uncharacterized protein n=1 Tax=Evansella vedderi TaxID=38282 RepID=A0ABT9ZQ53_9BACI|nr:hypothetical protein [Evansella vedderi]MDQ0253371.1 hypothetical protein [Evansella vedderi]